jgi:hypothetical protein
MAKLGEDKPVKPGKKRKGVKTDTANQNAYQDQKDDGKGAKK